MRNRIFIIIMLSIVTFVKVNAQNYLVYTVSGEVTNVSKKNSKIEAKQQLSGSTVIRLGNSSRLVLLDEKKRQLCTLKTPVEGKIQDIIKKSGNSSRSVSEQYVSYLLKRNTSADSKKNTHMQSTAVSYRDVELLETDSVEVKNDSINNCSKQ